MTTTQVTILGFVLLFLGTTLGSVVVLFVRKELSERLNTLFLGFAGGIMIAASVWSLLIPAIDSASAKWGDLSWVPAAVGFLIGGLFLVLLDRIIPHIHNHTHEEEGPKSQIHKTIKLFFAVTIHNIPEGLAVGFAFGAAAVAGDMAAYIWLRLAWLSVSVCSISPRVLPLRSRCEMLWVAIAEPFGLAPQVVLLNLCLLCLDTTCRLILSICIRGCWPLRQVR